jgi:DNA replication protein DnaC
MKYQLTVARLPFAKEVDEFVFTATPVNESLVRDLAGGGFLAHQRNLVLVGGTGSGKTHLAVGIARACSRSGVPIQCQLYDSVEALQADLDAWLHH